MVWKIGERCKTLKVPDVIDFMLAFKHKVLSSPKIEQLTSRFVQMIDDKYLTTYTKRICHDIKDTK